MRERQRGLALVLVLWLTTLLALIAGSYAYEVRTETRVIGAVRELAEGRALARAAVARVAFALAGAAQIGASDPGFPVNGSPWTWEHEEKRVRVRVIGATGLVDLNNASAALIEAILMRTGLDPAVAAVIPDRLADWRDRDDLHALNGAEDDAYRAAGRPEGAKDAPFEHAAEIGQVLGIDRTMADRLAPLVTVHGGVGLSAAHAPREVLALFDPAYAEDPAAIDPRAAATLIPASLQPATDQPEAFHLVLAVDSGGPVPRVFRVVIRLKQAEHRAYEVLEWTE